MELPNMQKVYMTNKDKPYNYWLYYLLVANIMNELLKAYNDDVDITTHLLKDTHEVIFKVNEYIPMDTGYLIDIARKVIDHKLFTLQLTHDYQELLPKPLHSDLDMENYKNYKEEIIRMNKYIYPFIKKLFFTNTI